MNEGREHIWFIKNMEILITSTALTRTIKVLRKSRTLRKYSRMTEHRKFPKTQLCYPFPTLFRKHALWCELFIISKESTRSLFVPPHKERQNKQHGVRSSLLFPQRAFSTCQSVSFSSTTNAQFWRSQFVLCSYANRCSNSAVNTRLCLST